MPRQKQSLFMAFSWPVSFWLIGCGLFFLISHATAQTIEDAQKDFLHGHYDAVIKTANKQIENGDYSGNWRVLLVKSLLMVGRYAEAHTNAIASLDEYSGALEKRLL